MISLFSDVFGVRMVLKKFWIQIAGFKAWYLYMAHITFYRNVISIAHTTSAVFVAFWLVWPFREIKNFIRFSSKL